MKSLVLLPLLLAVSCLSPAQTPILDFSDSGIGPLRFCDPLVRVDSLWPATRDTTLESEGITWPAKVVSVAGGGTLLVESSWMDHAHVWRASTDAASARSVGGLRVGMKGQEILDLGFELTVKYAEGYPYLKVANRGIALEVDSASTMALARDIAPQGDTIVRTSIVLRLLAHGPPCR